jgi:hypothetical protein
MDEEYDSIDLVEYLNNQEEADLLGQQLDPFRFINSQIYGRCEFLMSNIFIMRVSEYDGYQDWIQDQYINSSDECRKNYREYSLSNAKQTKNSSNFSFINDDYIKCVDTLMWMNDENYNIDDFKFVVDSCKNRVGILYQQVFISYLRIIHNFTNVGNNDTFKVANSQKMYKYMAYTNMCILFGGYSSINSSISGLVLFPEIDLEYDKTNDNFELCEPTLAEFTELCILHMWISNV